MARPTAERQEADTAFYGSGRTKPEAGYWLYVFAYNLNTYDAVWIKTNGVPMLDDEPEYEWPIPDDPEDFGEWCFQHSFQKIPLRQAIPAITDYLKEVQSYLDPENTLDMFTSASIAVQFVRAVRGMLTEVEEIEEDG